MQYFPSKKFLVVVIAGLIVISGWFLISQRDNNGNSSDKLSFISSMFKSDENDSDDDGLKDWEEVLWKTDKNNSDTDGDGTSDGEEIKQGRDPLKPGPDDKYYVSPLKASDIKTLLNPINSLTDSISRDLLTQYLSTKQLVGGQLNTSTKESMINSLLSKVDSSAYSITSSNNYKISDIKISQDNSVSFVKNYGNQLGAVLNKYNGPHSPGTELLFFKEAVEKDDPSGFETIGENIIVFEMLIKDLLGLTVPSDLKNAHLDLINSFSQFKQISFSFKNYPQDPLSAMVALSHYRDVQGKTVNALIFFRDYFNNKGINFDQDEPGYVIQNFGK